MPQTRRVPLLEREEIVAALTEYAESARAGAARVVLVGGEAGVGKTSLLEALREQLPDVRWLWGACDGAFTPQPLAPLFDIAQQVGGELMAACQEGAPRERLFRVLLKDLADTARLTVLVLEDVHWADEATLDVVQFLAVRLRGTRVLLVLTYRNDGLAHDDSLQRTIGEVGALRLTRRAMLPPLSRQTVAELAREGSLGGEELFRLTGGNPFLVTEVLALGTGEVPPSVRDAVLARVSRLPSGARAVLEAASVLGMRVEVGLLVDVAQATAAAIDACLAAGALVADGAAFRFRHDIARLAVEQALAPHRRAALHRRTLQALLARGVDDDALLAHHAEGAGDSAAVLTYAPRAACRAAELAAHREAVAQFERALRHVAGTSERLRAELLDGLSDEAVLIDRVDVSAACRETAIAIWARLDEPLRLGDDLHKLSRDMLRLCRGEEADALARQALEVLDPLPPSVPKAWAYAHLASLQLNQGDSHAMVLAQEAADLGDQLGAIDVVCHALITKGSELAVQGGGTETLERALQLALARDDAAGVGRAYANLHTSTATVFDFAAATRWYEEGLSFVLERDLRTFVGWLQGTQAFVLERLGAWTEAERLCRGVRDHEIYSPQNRLQALLVQARIRVRQGAPEAGALVDEALAAAQQEADPGHVIQALLARAEMGWLAGDTEAARAALLPASSLAAGLDGNTRAETAAWIRRCDGAPDLDGLASPYALEAAGDHLAAATSWREKGARYDAGLALLGLREEAAAREALQLFSEVGAAAAVTRAQSLLRELGAGSIPRGPRHSTRTELFGLTRREREVLGLVCEGLSNAEIAGRLYLSERTVEKHVSATLAKLDVSSRRAAVQKAAEAGLATA